MCLGKDCYDYTCLPWYCQMIIYVYVKWILEYNVEHKAIKNTELTKYLFWWIQNVRQHRHNLLCYMIH